MAMNRPLARGKMASDSRMKIEDHSTADAQAGMVVIATTISINGTNIWPTMMMVSQGAASSARMAPNFSPQAEQASTGFR